MKQGKLIVFEGLDGSGKTTQLERLGARLTEKLGTNAVYCTREPGDSAPGILCQQFSQKKLALAVCRRPGGAYCKGPAASTGGRPNGAVRSVLFFQLRLSDPHL